MLQGVLSQARPQIASLTSMQCGSSPAWHIQPHGKLSQRVRRRGLLAGRLQDIIPSRQLEGPCGHATAIPPAIGFALS